MKVLDVTGESPANRLCKACGLCCTGHLFIWTKLRSAELDSIEALGVQVFRSVPSQRGFNQPCPLWQGQCNIYETPQYPRFCGTYKCKLLKKLLDENISFPRAMSVINEAKALIQEVETLLPRSPNPNFRERLAARLEQTGGQNEDRGEFPLKARRLLRMYKDVFGVEDLTETPADS